MNERICGKGQIMSTDLVFAVVLFLAIVSTISYQWDSVLTRMNDVERATDAEMKSHMVSNFLTKTSGYPIGWTCGNVRVVGLCSRDPNVIATTRFQEFVNCTNNNATGIRERLSISDYSLFVNLTKTNGVEWNHTGDHVPTNATVVSTTVSYVLYNNEMSKLYVSLWK